MREPSKRILEWSRQKQEMDTKKKIGLRYLRAEKTEMAFQVWQVQRLTSIICHADIVSCIGLTRVSVVCVIKLGTRRDAKNLWRNG